MIYRFAFEAFRLREGYERVDAIDSHSPREKGDDVMTVHEPNGDVIAVVEIEGVCDFAGLTPPDLDQFCGD